MQICCPFIAAILPLLLVLPVDGFTVDYPEKCRNCGTGVYCFSISGLRKTDSPLNVHEKGMNGSTKKEVQMAHFILNIQVEGMHTSFKRFVKEINVLLEKEVEITVSSLDIQDKDVGGFPNKVDNLIISIQGKGTDASVRGLVQEIKALLRKQCQLIKSSLYREGQETHASISKLGQVSNVFLRKKRSPADISLKVLGLGVDASLNKLIRRRKPYLNKQHQKNEHRGDYFFLNIQVRGTDDSLKRLVQEIKAFFKTEDQISDFYLSIERQGIGDQQALFILSIQGRGTDSSIKRSIQVINGFLASSRELTVVSLNIHGKGLDASVYQLSQDINASLNKKQKTIDVPTAFTFMPNIEDKDDSIKEVCTDDIQNICQKKKGNCFREPCKGKRKENGSCGTGIYCCTES